ncbi:MAG: hypothetical protein DI629_04640 [Mesorhizobium amorphae]|nr:MAG: hypothetical protein DI629_04640 [Mesorhizobium amorphae]
MGCRRWQLELVARLEAAGHGVSIAHAPPKLERTAALDGLLRLESRRFGASLASPCAPPPASPSTPADLVIDLAGTSARTEPTLRIAFDGHESLAAGLAAVMAGGGSAEIALRLDGKTVAQGRPMISDRVWLSRLANDILAGAVSLAVHGANRFARGLANDEAGQASPVTGRKAFARHYPPFFARGIAARAREKLSRGKRPFYWQTAYRLIEGPGIAETGRLDGPPFTVLPDDGTRFYADPFVFAHEGRTFLFVEEFPYATGRGVLSVAELGPDGRFGTPRVVIEEPHHLSYPQVFAHGGEIYMLPESAAGRELVLYRARSFPDQWVRERVLLAGRDINDATLLEHEGRFWLFGTERFGWGSASDTMVAFHAPALHGPWTSHPLNPLRVDHSAARPGGAFLQTAEGVFLPVQDGSQAYGGGLGLMRLEGLDEHAVRFGPVRPIAPGPAWARRGIHTLNRAGAVEAIDSAG